MSPAAPGSPDAREPDAPPCGAPRSSCRCRRTPTSGQDRCSAVPRVAAAPGAGRPSISPTDSRAPAAGRRHPPSPGSDAARPGGRTDRRLRRQEHAAPGCHRWRVAAAPRRPRPAGDRRRRAAYPPSSPARRPATRPARRNPAGSRPTHLRRSRPAAPVAGQILRFGSNSARPRRRTAAPGLHAPSRGSRRAAPPRSSDAAPPAAVRPTRKPRRGGRRSKAESSPQSGER